MATVSEAHPDTMDFLSRAWCNFAIQAFQPESQDQSLALQESVPLNKFECDTKSPFSFSVMAFLYSHCKYCVCMCASMCVHAHACLSDRAMLHARVHTQMYHEPSNAREPLIIL